MIIGSFFDIKINPYVIFQRGQILMFRMSTIDDFLL